MLKFIPTEVLAVNSGALNAVREDYSIRSMTYSCKGYEASIGHGGDGQNASRTARRREAGWRRAEQIMNEIDRCWPAR